MSNLPTFPEDKPPTGLPHNVINLFDSIPHSTACAPARPGCTTLPAMLTPTHAAHRTLPLTIITDLQRALASNDPDCMSHMVSSIQACCTADRLTPLLGPDGLPLFVEIVALFCWGGYQNNSMIEDCLTTLLRLHNMNPSLLISQAVLQPLLETLSTPPSWLRPDSRL